MVSISVSRWLLPASLALNVFLGTVLVVREPGRPPGPPPGGPRNPMAIVEELAVDLSSADAAALRKVVAKRAQEIEYRNKVWRGTPERIATTLAAPDYRPEQLRAVLEEGREAHRAMDEAVGESILEAASALSPEGRLAVARWRPRGPERGGPPPMDGPPPPR